MRNIRLLLEKTYPFWRELLFFIGKDPETSHRSFLKISSFIDKLRLTDLFFYDPHLPKRNFFLSNAAGFDKNADIPPRLWEDLGFDRIVIGSITSKPFAGNPRPRVHRLVDESSLLNWMGLPNEGAEKIASRLQSYSNKIPLTINVASTPNASDVAQDIMTSLKILNPFGDRIEVNISCPNLENSKIAFKTIEKVLDLVSNYIKRKEIFLKLSPDWEEETLNQLLEISSNFPIKGFVACNSSLKHSYRQEANFKGGLSGNLLYGLTYSFIEKLNHCLQKSYRDKNWKIIACGGIDCSEKIMKYKKNFGIEEFQIYTSLIYQGPILLRQLIND